MHPYGTIETHTDPPIVSYSHLWIILAHEHERDGYMLRPYEWEGSGQYQSVRLVNDKQVLVKVGGKYYWGEFREPPLALTEEATRRRDIAPLTCHWPRH